MTLASVQLYGYIKVLRGFTFGGEAMGFAVGGCSEGLGDNYINSLTPPVFYWSARTVGAWCYQRYCHHLLWPPFCLVNSDFGWIIMICIFYRQACAKCSHAGIVFTQWSKNGFYATQERHVAPINVKFGTRERTAPCQIWGLSGGNVGMQPQNYQHFEFWP